MSGSIFLLQDGNQLVNMQESAYDSEKLLQKLLADHPDLLAGDQIDSDNPRRWILVSREISVPDEEENSGRWWLDHLFLDQDAIPTLVEVKRSSDIRLKRREVIAQLLDYAANAIVYWPVEFVQARFERTAAEQEADPAELLSNLLRQSEAFDVFWKKVKTNLDAGRIRLVLIADEIPKEVRRIVEFLNGQMDPAEFLAVEIKQYKGAGGLTTLVPRVIGQTAAAEQKKSGTSAAKRDKPWDHDSFFAKLAERGNDAERRVATTLFEWGKNNLKHVEFGTGTKMASFVPFDRYGEAWFCPFRVYTGYRAAYVEIPLKGSPMQIAPFDDVPQKLELIRRVNKIDGISIDEDVNRFPSIELLALAEGDRLAHFLEVAKWAVEQVRQRNSVEPS